MRDAGQMRSPGPARAARETIIAACVFSLVTVAFYHRALFFDEAFFSRDILPLFHPFREVIRRRILGRELPLWNPHLFGGMSMIGYIVVGPLYPLNLILLPFESVYAITLSVVVHHFLAALGMLLFLRRFGVEARPGIGAAVAYAFCGYIVSLDSDYIFVFGMAWLPWIGWALDRLFDERTLWSRIRLALLFTMQILSGDVQMVAVTGYVCLVLVLVRWDRSTPVTRIGDLAGSLLIAMGMSAVQLLPFLYLATQSLRWGGLQESEAWLWSFHPARIVELFAPCPFGTTVGGGPFWGAALVTPPRDIPWSHGLYVGVSVLFCAVFARRTHNKLALALWIVGGVALVLAMGHHAASLNRWVRRLLPLWSSFRYPEKLLALASFCATAAGGLGLQGLTALVANGDERAGDGAVVASASNSPAGRISWRYGAGPIWLAASLMLIALVAWGLLFLCEGSVSRAVGALVRAGGQRDVTVGEAMGVLRHSLGWTLAVLSSIVLLLLVQRRGYFTLTTLSCLWMFVLLFDVTAANLPLVDTTNRKLYDEPVPFIEAIRAAGKDGQPFRVYPATRDFATTFAIPREKLNVRARAWHRLSLFPNTAMTEGLLTATGYPSVAADFAEVWRAAAPHPDRLLNMMGIRFVVDSIASPAYRNTERMRPVMELRSLNLRLLERADPAPLARIVHRVRRARSWRSVIDALDDPNLDVMKEVILQDVSKKNEKAGLGEAFAAGPDTGSAYVAGGTVKREPEVGPTGRPASSVPPESVRIAVYEPERVVVEADVRKQGYLVLADRYDPGWRATVDGEPRRILRANGMQRAVRLEPGRHTVAFGYFPPSVRFGIAGMLLTLVLLALAGLRSAVRGHP